MPDSKNHISADQLAKLGKKKREVNQFQEQEKKKKASKSNLNYRRKADQKRIFLHISLWSDWIGVFPWLALLLIITAGPLIFMGLSMNETIGFPFSMIGVVICSIAIICLVGFIYSKKKVKTQVANEKKWIDNLPFKLIAYPDVLVYRSYPSIYFTLEFERTPPELSYLLDVLTTADYKISSKVEFDLVEDDFDEGIPPSISMFESIDEEESEVTELPHGAENIIFKFEMTNAKASKFNRHRRWARKWVHDTCEIQLQAIHHKFPIKSVTLNNGIIELDFEWWIDNRKWWQV